MEKELKLKVAEAMHNDVGRGIVRISSDAARRLGITTGDVVEIKGAKTTVAKVWQAHPQDEGLDIIRMDGILRQNSSSSLGDKVTVIKAVVNDAKSIAIAPTRHEISFGGDFANYVKQKILMGRPLTQGDNFIITVLGQSISFTVTQTKPKGVVQVNEYTTLDIKSTPQKVSAGAPAVRYEDIGGLRDEIARVRELIELPMKHPELFEKLGIQPPKGVLLYGPPGTGKTLLAKAVASETNAHFIPINGPEIMDKFYGESERKLRDIFEEAQENAPSIIFIDEIDSIAPKREETRGEVERRVVAQLLALMDGLIARGNVIVIAATNRQNDIDPALRRPGRFDREIEIGVPDKNGRKEILQIHTRGMPLKDDVDLDEIAGTTHGFVGADLAALAREAAMSALRRILPQIDLEKEELPAEVLENLDVRKSDFTEALKIVEPSALREVLVEVSEVKWKDIGGLAEVKKTLQEIVEWPLKKPETFKRIGIKPAKGVLLYGPAGCGKTLLAKAIANESEANFIAVKGPEILCVSADTNILTDFCGVRTIGEFYNTAAPLSELKYSTNELEVRGLKKPIYSYAISDDGGLIKTRIKTMHKLWVDECYSIELSNNGRITGSRNQPLMAFKDGRIQWVRLEDVKDGDFIAYPARLPTFNKKVALPFPKHKHIRKIKEDEEHYYARIFSTKQTTRLPKHVTTRLASFLGWFVSEGSISKGGICVCNYNKENQKEIKELFKQFVEEKRITVYRERVVIYSTVLVKYLEGIFGQKLDTKKCYTIKCPGVITKASEEVITAFLRSAFRGGGHIDDKKIEYSTMSKHLAEGICYMLTLSGIKYRLWKRKDKSNMITISGKKEIDSFKNKVLNKNIDEKLRREYNARYTIPPVGGLLKEAKIRLGLHYDKELPDGSFEHVISGRRKIGLLRLKRIMDVYHKHADDSFKKTEIYRTLDFIAESDVLWATVKNKKRAEPQIMYDIETEHSSFVGGNLPLILHNSKWVGESEKGMREVFKKARQTAPTIILFDEIDAIAPRRGMYSGSHVTETVVNQLLTELDGIENLDNVVVVGTTNRHDMLDPSVIRPGRIDTMLLVPAPDKEARLDVLKIHTKDMPMKGVNLEGIAKRTENYSGADLEAVCREAGLNALRESIDAKSVLPKHFDQALDKIKPSITEDITKYYQRAFGKDETGPAYG